MSNNPPNNNPPNNELPNYVKTTLKAIQSGTFKIKPGTVNHIHVQHDDDCNIFTGGPCNCDPDIYLEVKNDKLK